MTRFPNLLLINSGDKDAFAAVYSGGKLNITSASEFDNLNSLNKKPDKLIDCVYKLSQTFDLNKIDAIAVTIGPGSFTGIRVGLSIAKGAAFGLQKKLIPLSNFELVINRVNSEKAKTYCVLIPAKLPEYYYSVYKEGNSMSTGCTEIENLNHVIDKEVIIVGDFDDETSIKHSYFEYINAKNLKSEADSVLELALEGFKNGKLFDAAEVEPLYLKDFIVKENSN